MKLPRREHAGRAEAEEALHGLDASEQADRRGAPLNGRRRDGDHDEADVAISRREIEAARQTGGADLESVEQRIDGEPLIAVVDGGEAVAKSRLQPSQPPYSAFSAEDDEGPRMQRRIEPGRIHPIMEWRASR